MRTSIRFCIFCKKWTLGRHFCPLFRGKRIIPAFPFFYSPFERRSDTGHRALLVHSFCVMRREDRPPNFGITCSPFRNKRILLFISALELKCDIFSMYYCGDRKCPGFRLNTPCPSFKETPRLSWFPQIQLLKIELPCYFVIVGILFRNC